MASRVVSSAMTRLGRHLGSWHVEGGRRMADATGEARRPPLRVAFDRPSKLELEEKIASAGRLLVCRALGDIFGLTAMAVSALAMNS